MRDHLSHVVDALVNETDGAISRHRIEAVVQDCYSQLAAQATIPTYLPILTGRMAGERLARDGAAATSTLTRNPEVLVVCEANSARSQATAALLRFYAPGRLHVLSAGTKPGGTVNLHVMEVLASRGVHLTDFPKEVSPDMLNAANHVLVVGELGQPLTEVAGQDRRVWDFPTLDDADEATVIQVLTDIDAAVRDVLAQWLPNDELPPAAFSTEG